MLNRTLALTLLAVAYPTTAMAVDAPARAIAAPGERELANGRILAGSPDRHRWRATSNPLKARAFKAVASDLGSAWATWDSLNEHPRQIMGTGMEAPGTIASPTEAQRVAEDFLARHIALLAPGSHASDFVLISNDESSGIRSLGFAQFAGGREVVGGQIGLVFAHDRLVLINNLAQPYPYVATSSARVTDSDARERARRFIDDDFHPARLRSGTAVEGPLVLPVGDMSTGPRYREVVRTEVHSEAPLGRWTVYVDAETGEPVARESRMHNASGLVFYNVPDRSPIFSRSDRAVPFTQHIVDGAPQVSDGVGFVGFVGATSNINPGLSGPLGQIVDEGGPLATTTLVLADGGGVSWNMGDNEIADAQITTYTHLLLVKNYVAQLDSTLPWLGQPTTATVNIDDQCNAMSDGDSLFFFRASDSCENTGRMADVVYHEAGHSVHHQSIIPGVGSFDGALSEGVSDYLAATMLNDSGMARGFFYTEEPLREINPQGFEYRWPEDNGEVHDAGRIISGALWDLRTLLIAKYGPEEGVRRADIVYYEGTRRAVDMPSMYGAALIANDDDGNLGNGTPDGCEINAAFGSHGLFAGGGPGSESVTTVEIPEGLAVRADLALPSFEACPLQATARIEWGPRDGDMTVQSAEMAAVSGGYEAVLPALPPGQVMRYRVIIDYSIGTERLLPSNQGDPWLQHWFGAVEPIYCTSFENASADGWDYTTPWDVDVPAGLGGDPSDAAGADPFALGLDLNGDGLYPPGTNTSATSPTIAIPPGYASVRLHYKRWLTVEDGFFDQASILVDDEVAWDNFASSAKAEGATVHHRDSQWVFHDVDITPWALDGELDLAFTLRSDGGLEMGGWTVDDLCVVGYNPGAQPMACGNAIIEAGENCDDGNVVDGDGCSAQCQLEDEGDGGDGPSDSGDPTDDGDGGLVDDGLVDRGCACQAGPVSGPWGTMGLVGLLFFGLRRRKN